MFNTLLEDNSLYDLDEKQLLDVKNHFLWLKHRIDFLLESRQIAPVKRDVK